MSHAITAWLLTPPGAATNEATFIALRCPRPAGRRFDLFQFVAQMNRDEDVTGELESFLACLQDVTDLILCDLDRFTDIIDPHIAPEPFLSLMLLDLGNPFDFELSEIDKRRLIDVLMALYKEKGTGVGIIDAIRFFMGIEVTLDIFNSTGWVLGEDELGVDTEFAASLQFLLYSFNIISPVALTTDQRTRMRQLTKLTKVAHEHLVDIIEPDTSVIDHWELGLSELGVTTDLHE